MATEVGSKQNVPRVAQQQQQLQPPSYFPNPPGVSNPAQQEVINITPEYFHQHQQSRVSPVMPLLQPGQPTTTVLVTQPVVVGNAQAPDTTRVLVMSTLSAILCGFWCGAAGMVAAWKARMQVLDKKYEHASHTLNIAWLFFMVATIFGIVIWTFIGIFISSHFWYYY